MAIVTNIHPVDTLQGEIVHHSGFIFRRKHAHDENGQVIHTGKQECYKVVHPRDFEKPPPVLSIPRRRSESPTTSLTASSEQPSFGNCEKQVSNLPKTTNWGLTLIGSFLMLFCTFLPIYPEKVGKYLHISKKSSTFAVRNLEQENIMPNIQNIPFIIYLLCAMHIAWFGVAGAWLLYHHREQHDHSRLYIGGIFLFVAIGCLQFIVTGMVRDDYQLFMNTLLEPYPAILYFVPVLLPSLYVLEVMQAQWLTWKRFLLLISPWMVLVIVWLVYHGMHDWQYSAITYIGHVSEILPNIHQTDVLLRVLLVAIHVPYILMILLVRYRWRICNVSYWRIVWLKVLVVLWAVCYIVSLRLRIHEVFIFYFVLLDGISVYVFHLEKFHRIPVPQDEELSLLAQRLQQLMAQGIWQDPDLDREDICKLLGTNYTYLSSAIQELNYASFYEMINQQRAQYMHHELTNNPTASISDIIYRAGYRSRTTAMHYFTQVYHCAPSSLLRQKKG